MFLEYFYNEGCHMGVVVAKVVRCLSIILPIGYLETLVLSHQFKLVVK